MQSMFQTTFTWRIYHLCQLYISSNHTYPAFVLFEQVIALNADKFLLYTVTDRNIAFFWYPFHMLPVELCESTCKSSSFPADRKYQKGKSSTDPCHSFVQNTYKLYILWHCINIVFIVQKNHMNPLTFIFWIKFLKII
jgi:hypothetical protein